MNRFHEVLVTAKSTFVVSGDNEEDNFIVIQDDNYSRCFIIVALGDIDDLCETLQKARKALEENHDPS